MVFPSCPEYQPFPAKPSSRKQHLGLLMMIIIFLVGPNEHKNILINEHICLLFTLLVLMRLGKTFLLQNNSWIRIKVKPIHSFDIDLFSLDSSPGKPLTALTWTFWFSSSMACCSLPFLVRTGGAHPRTFYLIHWSNITTLMYQVRLYITFTKWGPGWGVG